jgi:iron complex outermembrane recepter protein
MAIQTMHVRRAVAMLLALSAPIASRAVWAQEATDSDVNSPELVEIIVTAEKRQENIQDVPISVISLSSQALQDAGVKDLSQLQVLTPGLTVSSDASENTTVARIRGIGTVGDNPGLESSVGLVIDGVYRPRNGVGFGNLGELEQIQVLEGPQGELFGKNNDAGVIVVTTKQPTRTFSATAEATYGNYNDREISASVNGPLNDFTAGRIYVEWEKRDGWLNVNTGLGPNTNDKTDSRNGYVVRGQLLFTISGNADFLLIGDYSKRNESCCGAVPRVTGPFQAIPNAIAGIPALGGTVGASAISLTPSTNTAWANEPIRQEVRDMGVSGEFHLDLGFGKFTSITAWRDNTLQIGSDLDYTGIDILQTPDQIGNSSDFKQFSQELRLAGKAGPVDWLVGAFYANEILSPNITIWAGDNFNTFLSGTASVLNAGGPNFGLLGNAYTPGVSGYSDRFRQTDNSWAVFTDETWRLTDKLDLTGGVRYTNEDKKATSSFLDNDGGAGCASLLTGPAAGAVTPIGDALLFGIGCSIVFNPLFNNVVDNQSLHESNVSGTVKVAYHFTDDIMAYASWGNGYKAGGFNLARVTPPGSTAPLPTPILNTEFPDETVDSYEVGFKSTWFSKTLRLNGAIFDQKYKDFQLDTFTGIEFIVTSLRAVSSKGADLDAEWATPIRGLTFNAGATYAFTNIDEFGDGAPYFNAARLNDRLSFAPLWSGAASATYQVPLGHGLMARGIIDEKYNTSYNTGSDLDPNKLQGAYGLMDARIGIGSSDNKWSVELWGQNLLNKFYYQVAFDGTFQLGQIDAFPGAPRFFGITGRVSL